MGNVGQPVNLGYFHHQPEVGDGTTTPFTLDYGVGSSASIEVVIAGVRQTPTTDYTAVGTVFTLTTLVASPIVIDVYFKAQSVTMPEPGNLSVTTLKLVDDSVTLAKMAGLTAGNLITGDASGNPAAVATGTAGQVLTSGGAGVAPTFATASSSSPSQTNFQAKSTSGQTIPTGAFTKVTLAGENFDTDSLFDSSTNSRLTPGAIGTWLLTANPGWGPITGDGTRWRFRIYKNGSWATEAEVTDYISLATSSGTKYTLTGLFTTDADDYFEVYVHHTQGSNATLNSCFFSGFKIS